MLGLKLRDEFLGTQMPGTAITLRTGDNQGAAQKSAESILSITYPTADVQTALKSISNKKSGRPIILMGDRGRGKSHIMAVMHHAIASPDVVEQWFHSWGKKSNSSDMQEFEAVKSFFPISEPVHNYEYPLLWDLLFDRHPKGQYYRGQFEGLNQPFPPRTLLEKMFEEQPVCLILDEFQTWFTGLPEKDPKTGFLLRQWAFNFIQNLSEIAKDRPEILILVISVLNNQNEAFRQVHRQSPVVVDFRGPTAKQDRQKLLLHRLFENRINISDDEIATIAGVYANERFRLLHSDKSDADKNRIYQETYACWPFSPELVELLEDHILLSEAAQETRDLIRILAQVYRTRGESVPMISPADFFVDGDTDEVQTLVDSIAVQAGQEKLRQIAQRNLQSVRDAGANVPNARELISAIWMRSMSPGKVSGGTPVSLHLDITRSQQIDDNSYQAELATLIENSVNIHGDEVPGGPLWFGLQENPRSKVRACAKNNKLWYSSAVPTNGQTVYPGKDIEHIRKTLRHELEGPTTRQSPSRIIVLGPNWQSDPWNEVDDADRPDKWDRPVLIVIPDQLKTASTNIGEILGPWLAKHVQKKRNTIRFLLVSQDSKSVFEDYELLFNARCSFLCSKEAWGTESTYSSLHKDFDRPMRQSLRSRFNRFAVLRKWNYQQPEQCEFEAEKINEQGAEIAQAVESKILTDLFDRTDFTSYIINRAKDGDFIGSIMDDLSEPPPPNMGEAIPFLGEVKMYEFILEIAASGDIALSVNGTWISRRSEDETDADALRFIRQRGYRTGQELRQVQLGLPSAVGGGTVTVPPSPAPQPPVTPTPIDPTTPSDQPSDDGQPFPPSTSPSGEPPHVSEKPLKEFKCKNPSSGINLSGCFETWGVSSSKSLDSAAIEFNGISVQQMKQILQRIPSSFKATMSISFQEGDE